MAQEVWLNYHVDGIVSDPHLIERGNEIVVALVVSINGKHTVLSLPQHTAKILGHALSVAPLPLVPGQVGPERGHDET